MRTNIIAGNWKMNMTISDGLAFVKEILKLINSDEVNNKKVILFPPYIHLFEFNNLLSGSSISFGAQNVHHESHGAFTGELSAAMIKSTGAEYVIIGHSERRKYFNEENNLLSEKINISLENNLIPIYCCGETLEERESGKYFEIVKTQVEQGLFNLEKEEYKKIIIAYEPVWAIGTGETATPDQAQEMHAYIRKLIEDKYGLDISKNTSILYGGSIKSGNSQQLFAKKDINGGLIGGASLQPSELYLIINSA